MVAVNTLRPLREQTLTGTVSRISHGNGIINDDIYFTMSSCCRGYQPLVGDSVSVVCVECVRHQCNWRACSVKPDTQDSSERFEANKKLLYTINVEILACRNLAISSKPAKSKILANF